MGRTGLHYAVANNELETVKELLKLGANINAQTLGGDTPLMKAIETGRFDIVNELIQWNCNCNIPNKVI